MSLFRNSTSLSLSSLSTLKIALYRDCTQSGIVLYLQDGNEFIQKQYQPVSLQYPK